MFAFARRPEPQRRPIGAPGISEEQYERIAARIRDERIVSAILRSSGVKSSIAAVAYQRDSTSRFYIGTRS